jgi:hypothetical protein
MTSTDPRFPNEFIPGRRVRLTEDAAARYNWGAAKRFEIVRVEPGSGTGILVALLDGEGRRQTRGVGRARIEDRVTFPSSALLFEDP